MENNLFLLDVELCSKRKVDDVAEERRVGEITEEE